MSATAGGSPGLADSVAATIGWQVRQADVLAGVPETDQWVVMGRSDTREDRIEVVLETFVAEVRADQRHRGRPGEFGGAEQAAVAAEDDDELGPLGGRGAGRC